LTDGEKQTVAIDASVLINLAIVGRLDLLRKLGEYRFVVPLDALEEVERLAQRSRVDAALERGHLSRVELAEPRVLARRAALLTELGPGESACLALAAERGWLVACDEKRAFRRIALHLLGEGRLINTAGLFVLGIRWGYWTVADADRAKDVLADNRFQMKLETFGDLL
jgi:predicted nucleic acid-binding protein